MTSVRGMSRSYAAIDSVQCDARSNPAGRSKCSSTACGRCRVPLRPDSPLQHQAQRLDDALDAVISAFIFDPQALPFPDRLGDRSQVRHRVTRLEPSSRVEVEPLDEARGSDPQLGGQRGKDFESGCGPQAQLRGWPGQTGEEESLGLVSRHTGEPGAVPLDQLHAAVRAALGVDRDARLAQCVNVAMDGPLRDLELLRQLRGRHPTAGLQEEEHGDQPRRTHRGSC